MLIDLIGMNAAMDVFDHLNRLVGKHNQEQAGEAIAAIVYAMQSRLNAQRDEWIETT
jgi:hypothetical protein